MCGIYLDEVAQIVQEYDKSWRFHRVDPAVTQLREFLEKNKDDFGYYAKELNCVEFLFIFSLSKSSRHAIFNSLRILFNRHGLLDFIQKMESAQLASDKNIMLIAQLFGMEHYLEKIKPCLWLLAEHHLIDVELLQSLVDHADDFTFIYASITTLAAIENGCHLSKANLDYILFGNNAVMLSELLPILCRTDFFSTNTLCLLCHDITHASRMKHTLYFLEQHGCLDEFIFSKLMQGDSDLNHHVEFISGLLMGIDCLNKTNVRLIFSFRDDYYARQELSLLAEEGVLTELLFQQKAQGFTDPIKKTGKTLEKSKSCSDLQFFKNRSEPLSVPSISLRHSR